MSLPHAILGLLAIEPMTGYDLKTRWFDRALRYFWPADQAQIYRSLETLAKRGWASSHIEPATDRPNRKVYTLSEDGRVELRRWLTTPQPLPAVRDPLLVQLFCGAEVANSDLLQMLAQQETAHRDRLVTYETMRQTFFSVPAPGRRERLWRLTLENGIRRERAYLDWLAAATAELDEYQSEA